MIETPTPPNQLKVCPRCSHEARMTILSLRLLRWRSSLSKLSQSLMSRSSVSTATPKKFFRFHPLPLLKCKIRKTCRTFRVTKLKSNNPHSKINPAYSIQPKKQSFISLRCQFGNKWSSLAKEIPRHHRNTANKNTRKNPKHEQNTQNRYSGRCKMQVEINFINLHKGSYTISTVFPDFSFGSRAAWIDVHEAQPSRTKCRQNLRRNCNLSLCWANPVRQNASRSSKVATMLRVLHRLLR